MSQAEHVLEDLEEEHDLELLSDVVSGVQYYHGKLDEVKKEKEKRNKSKKSLEKEGKIAELDAKILYRSILHSIRKSVRAEELNLEREFLKYANLLD